MIAKILLSVIVGVACVGGDAFAAAAATKKQSAIQNGTTVRARVAPSGIYDQACYEAYYGCLDQFCISENENGGSCACSDKNAEYEKQLADIKNILGEAERISTVEVVKYNTTPYVDKINNVKVKKSVYLDMSLRFVKYCEKNHRVPSNIMVTGEVGSASFELFTYCLSKILTYLKKNGTFYQSI